MKECFYMPKEQSEHEKYYRTLHACIWAHLTEDDAEIASFHSRFSQNPDNWTRALACGFYRVGYMQLEDCAEAKAGGKMPHLIGNILGTIGMNKHPKIPDF
jgi:hypothetical protein